MPRLRLVVLAVVATAALAPAQAVYTFESPTFPFGVTTPFLNVAPSIGLPSLRASFMSAPTGNGFGISTGPPPLTGQILVDLGGLVDTLTVQLNAPVTQVSVAFFFNAPAAGPPGTFRAVTSAGTFSQPGSNFGGPLQGGILNFSAPGGITDITFSAFDSANVPVFYAIDNLSLTPVPEPSALALAGAACAIAALRRRRPS